ncbi:hypothetical protein RCL1_001139 [Eukaryota sp. TZLM3-RCL]
MALEDAYESRLASFQSLLNQVQDEYELLLQENLSLKKRLNLNEPAPTISRSHSIKHSDSPPVAFASRSVMDYSYTEPKWKTLSTRLRIRPHSPSFYTPSFHFLGHSDSIQDLALSSTSLSPNPFLAVSSLDHTVTLWSGNKSVAIIDKHKGSVNSVRFHDTSPLLLTASGDKTVCLFPLNFDTITSSDDVKLTRISDPLSEFKHGNSSMSHAVFFGKEVVASSSYNGFIYLSSIHDQISSTKILDQKQSEVMRLSTCQHDSALLLLACFSDGTSSVYDVRQSDSCVMTFTGHNSCVTAIKSCQVEPNIVITSSVDRHVNIYDIRGSSSLPIKSITADCPVSTFAVSPTSPVIAIPSESRRIRLYDFHGHKITSCRSDDQYGHTMLVSSLLFGWKETTLYSGGFESMIIEWTERNEG